MKLFWIITLFLAFNTQAFASSKSDVVFSSSKKNSVGRLKTRAINQAKYLEKRGYKTDQVKLNIARTYYDKGQLSKAIEYYDQIPKSSDLWLESVEEKGWAYLRAGDHAKSMEQTLTLLAPVFDQHVNSEVYYLAAANKFFVCDYVGVFDVVKQFKTRYRPRIVALEQLSDTGTNKDLKSVLKLALAGPVTYESAAKASVGLPLYHYRDVQLQPLYSQLKKQSNNIPVRSKIEKRISSRIQKLARLELDKIKKDIDKLLVLEAEIIQRVYELNNKPLPPQKELDPIDGKKYLSFPVVNTEVWVDELNSFEAKTSECPNRLIAKEGQR